MRKIALCKKSVCPTINKTKSAESGIVFIVNTANAPSSPSKDTQKLRRETLKF